MFKPIRWNTLLRDIFVIEIGLGLFGLSIAMMIRANLGTSAWAVLEVAISNRLSITPGTTSVLVSFFVLLGALALREKVGWGTVANILSIGVWEDLALYLLPSVHDNLPVQIAMLLGGIAMMGIASAIYIGVDAGAGPRDSLMLGIQRKTGWSVRVARACLELTVVTIGWLMGGPAGIGTLVFAILIGPSVQAGFKLFKVNPHRDLHSEVEDG